MSSGRTGSTARLRRASPAETVVGLGMLHTLLISMSAEGFAPILPAIKSELGLNSADVSLIPTSILIGYTVASLASGMLADSGFGPRRLLSASLAIMAATLGLMAISANLGTLVLLGFVMGFATSAGTPALAVSIGERVSPGRRSVAMGISLASAPLAGILGCMVLPHLVVSFGWRVSTGVLALLSLAGCCAVAKYFPGEAVDRPRLSDSRPGGYLSILGNRTFWLIAFAGSPMLGIHTAAITFTIISLTGPTMAFGYFDASVGLCVCFVGALFGRVVLGYVVKAGGFERGAKVLIATSIGSACSCLAMALGAPGAPHWVVLFLLFGLGACAMGWQGIYHTLFSHIVTHELVGRAVATATSVRTIAALPVPFAFGLVLDRAGSPAPAWTMLAMMALVGAGLMAGCLLPAGGWRTASLSGDAVLRLGIDDPTIR